jgi:uncharacterized membrane protein YdbT with pleckstrin-like domain
VFVPAILVAVPMAILSVTLIVLAHTMTGLFRQLAAQFPYLQATVTRLSWLWLLPLVPGWLTVAGLFLEAWLCYTKSEVTLTNRRLVFRTGFISRRSGDLPLENIESIFISEPLFGRIMEYGTIRISTIGGAGFALHFMSGPQGFHAALQDAVTKARSVQKQSQKTARPVSASDADDSRYKPKQG